MEIKPLRDLINALYEIAKAVKGENNCSCNSTSKGVIDKLFSDLGVTLPDGIVFEDPTDSQYHFLDKNSTVGDHGIDEIMQSWYDDDAGEDIYPYKYFVYKERQTTGKVLCLNFTAYNQDIYISIGNINYCDASSSMEEEITVDGETYYYYIAEYQQYGG